MSALNNYNRPNFRSITYFQPHACLIKNAAHAIYLHGLKAISFSFN